MPKAAIKPGSIKAYGLDEESVLYVQTKKGDAYSQTHDRGDHNATIKQLALAINCLGEIELPGDWVKL